VATAQRTLIDLGPAQALYPFAQQHLAVPGGTMSYVDEGSGPVVVLLHGNLTWSFYYRRLILALRESHRVIAPDHLGCGLSEKPQGYLYQLANHIKNLALLLRHLGVGEADMVVHDWGGPIGLGYAVRHELRLRRLVVMNSMAFLPPRVPLPVALGQVAPLGELLSRRQGVTPYAAPWDTPALPQDVREGHLMPYRSHHDRIALQRFVEDLPTHPSHPTWPLMEAIDRQIGQFRETPTLILWGGRDTFFDDSFLSGWMQRFPLASAARYDEAGHYLLEEAPDAVARVARFLA